MEENSLIKRIQSGDGDAFRDFYAAYAGPVYRLLLERCGDRDAARRLAKEVFSQVYARLKAGEDVAWLYLEALSLQQLNANAVSAGQENAAPPQPGSAEPAQTEQPQREAEQPRAESAGPVQETAPAPPEDGSIDALRRQARAQRHVQVKARRRAGGGAMALLAVLLILILLWILTGYLMGAGVLPHSNLGYEWFNAHVYPLF